VPEPFLELHPATAAAASIQEGEWALLETAMGRIRLKARYKDSLHPGVVATTHGWWQACQELGLPGYDPFGSQGANANLLVSNDIIDPISGSVPHRSQRCRVRKASLSA
jgi:anaerobic selenocysteine-containing dehydrogenase